MQRVRNMGIVAHIDAGKTTLTERILFDAGRQSHLGNVDDGTAAMDWMREEQERGISITAAATRFEWRGHRIHLIDTPGHVDFIAEVERCMRVLDGVVVVLDGVKGVESQTITVWRQADRWAVPRLAFVNKMDRVGADFDAAAADLGRSFECQPVPVVIPLGGDGWSGLADVVQGTVHWFVGEPGQELLGGLRQQVAAARLAVVEVCAEFDDAVLADWLADRPVSVGRLSAAVRRGCHTRRIVPVLCGSALQNRGVDLLLDAVCSWLPAPIERTASGVLGEPRADPAAPFCGVVFKVQHTDTVLNYLRVFAGRLRPGDTVRCTRTGRDVMVPTLWAMHASHHEEIDLAEPGDVVVIAGRLGLATGDTICDPRQPTRLEPMQFPAPVVSARFEPEVDSDRERLLASLQDLCGDDPTLEVRIDAESGVAEVAGMGELHLEILTERLRRMSGLRVRMGRASVALCETVRRTAQGQAEIRTPVAGQVRTARAKVEVEPLDLAMAAEVVVSPGGAVDSRHSPAAVEAVKARLRSGLRLPVPTQGVRVRIDRLEVDGATPGAEVLALQALRVAVDKAVAGAELVLLEPVASFELHCPEGSLSAVLADLNSRQAEVRQVSSGGLGARVQGRAAMRSLLGYATRLRSITRGMGMVQVQPEGHAPIPSDAGGPEKGAQTLDPDPGGR